MAQVKSILLVGVGGQGTILVSKILTAGLLKAGYDVKMSEIHGMAQRGGSVSTTIRYGEKVYSPVIGLGEADVLISFEKMEAVRWSPYLKPEGIAVINDYEIAPLPVAIGKAEYPQNTIESMKACFDTRVLPGAELAEKAGRVINVSMELPKSFVVCSSEGKIKVYISQISSSTLLKRTSYIDDISNV